MNISNKSWVYLMRRAISLLGSTGSIGRQSLNVVRNLGGAIDVVGLAARNSVDLLESQIREFQPEIVALFEEKAALELKRRMPGCNVVCGIEGLCEVASWHSSDFVIMGMVGSKGVLPAVEAIQSGKDIGLANKEILVIAGEIISRLAKENGVKILPIDSEHSAILQCLQGESIADVNRIILTASGGPFLHHEMDELKNVTVKEATNHPTWSMGNKVSIDCSTLMNKGFEIMEARWLFDIPLGKIDVVIHPQSLVHSFVEFIDGSVKAQVGAPNMEGYIQYALTYPERRARQGSPFNFSDFKKWEFYPINLKKFACLGFCYDASERGGTYPCALNAGNEVLVERFCQGTISWLSIAEKLEKIMDGHQEIEEINIESILEVDRETRLAALTV